jgi:HK97 gp10 family phage protein
MEATLSALGELDRKVAQTILASSITAASKPYVKAARRRVPVDTGLLKLSLGAVTRKYRAGSGRIAVRVMGPRVNFAGKKAEAIRQGINRKPHKYAHLVEFGTEAHTIQPKRAAALDAPIRPLSVVDVMGATPRPFMRQAWDATVRRMEKILAKQLKKQIATAAEDARRRSRQRLTKGIVSKITKIKPRRPAFATKGWTYIA